jgi:hypothetical protein
MRRWLAVTLIALCFNACKKTSRQVTGPAGPPTWHIEPYAQSPTTNTLLAMWGRSDNVLFAVGTNGTIMTKTQEGWALMASPTSAHLTAIIGVENGDVFGLPNAVDGEMFAVGWQGTILHYHPNPDGDPNTDDGTWQIIAAPEGASLQPVLRPDPACPDFDGDGIPDDGDGDGWAGNAPCAAGNYANCDDNCRTTANGTLRPLVDPTGNGCLQSGVACSYQDRPDLFANDPPQQDTNGNGIGDACEVIGTGTASTQAFAKTLFGVWAQAQGNNVQVLAVGEDGTIISYSGASAAVPVTPTTPPAPPVYPITDAHAWRTETKVAFRYDDDCPASTPAGQACTTSSHLPATCPAECNPEQTQCPCPLVLNQCCDAAASTGVGCVNASCPPAANACNGATGSCLPWCPSCFRHLEESLYAISASGTQVVAVGGHGTVIVNDLGTLSTSPWTTPTATPPSGIICAPPPAFLDPPQKLAAIAGTVGNWTFVGQSGTVVDFSYSPSSCSYSAPAPNGPAGFLSGIHILAQGVFAVGDEGLLVQIPPTGAPVVQIPTGVQSNLYSLWSITNIIGEPEIWIVGGSGAMLRAIYY